jgi:hypothetical protein
LSFRIPPKFRRFLWLPTTWNERPTSGGSGSAGLSKRKGVFFRGLILKVNFGLDLALPNVKILMKLFQGYDRKDHCVTINENLNAWAIVYEVGHRELLWEHLWVD